MTTKRKKTRRKKRDVTQKVYTAKLDGVLSELQKCLNDTRFKWIELLAEKEVRFIYDNVSKANIDSKYQLTEKQSKWDMAILLKIKSIKVSASK